MIRRLKDVVLNELPPKERRVVQVAVSDSERAVIARLLEEKRLLDAQGVGGQDPKQKVITI